MLLAHFDFADWRKINFRSCDSVLAAEFLHGLYARHDPFLNPIRFCNTLVHFSPWSATGLAPRREWGMLASRFGGRLLRRPEAMAQELDRVLSNPRSRSRALAAELSGLDFHTLADGQLLDLALEMHHVPLGEIYEVNLVQVEHATDAALRIRLVELMGEDTDGIDAAVAALLTTDEATESNREERCFLERVLALKQRPGELDPAILDQEVAAALASYGEHAAAYGATSASADGFRNRFHQYLRLTEAELGQRLERLTTPRLEYRATTLLEDPLVRFLVETSRRTGSVRDRNKALLGRITRHRRRLLEAIGERRGVHDDRMRLYLLEEVLRLIETGVRVPEPELDLRASRGLVFRRHEHVSVESTNALQPVRVIGREAPSTLEGLCASEGQTRGRVCVVRSAADLAKMKLGDVLVAPGTDFDLLALLTLAGAIVTEEGGVLSHAAVVARERRVPCVIGVHSATAVLEDGELVEVDAGRGLVRRLTDTARESGSPPSPTPTSGVSRSLEYQEDPSVVGNKIANLVRLRAAGERVVPDMRVIEVGEAAAMLDELGRGRSDKLVQVAAEVASQYEGHRVNLRSSSTCEDGTEMSAAGIYTSAIAIPARVDALAAALQNVVSSGVGKAAAAYHAQSPDAATGLAILVARYVAFEDQGTSMSVSPWQPDCVLIEHRESGFEDESTPAERLHLPRDATNRDGDRFDSPWRRLCTVADTTLRIERHLGVPVEVEWGLTGGQCVVLQARPITTLRHDERTKQAG